MIELFFESLNKHINTLETGVITNERKQILQSLVDYIRLKRDANKAIRLNFICTHNSRRSHLSQIWAQTMAAYYNVNNLVTYSGGTEATALFPKIAETLIGQGFKVEMLSKSENPIYSIKYSENDPAIIGFSKTYDDDFNPKTGFAAIMTCSSADEGCPLVVGSDARIPITYIDPKTSDGTSQQDAVYLERSIQIATEMKFVFGSL